MDHQDTRIRVLVVDDHDYIRSSLTALLSTEKDIAVVGEARNGLDALEKIRSASPHVVLMDIQMPVMDGFEAMGEIHRQYPAVRVLAVTHLEDGRYFDRLLRLGASGIVLKGCAVDDLKNAIRTVRRGSRFLSSPIAEITLTEASAVTTKVTLTAREREVLERVATGFSTQETADALHLNVGTVEFHEANLMEKLGVQDVSSLVRHALAEKLITIDP